MVALKLSQSVHSRPQVSWDLAFFTQAPAAHHLPPPPTPKALRGQREVRVCPNLLLAAHPRHLASRRKCSHPQSLKDSPLPQVRGSRKIQLSGTYSESLRLRQHQRPPGTGGTAPPRPFRKLRSQPGGRAGGVLLTALSSEAIAVLLGFGANRLGALLTLAYLPRISGQGT